MKPEKAIKELADIIEANPKSEFVIDNDCWCVNDVNGKEIASSDKYHWDTNWYSHSGNYGFGLSEVLIELLKRRGLTITASAV